MTQEPFLGFGGQIVEPHDYFPGRRLSPRVTDADLIQLKDDLKYTQDALTTLCLSRDKIQDQISKLWAKFTEQDKAINVAFQHWKNT